MTKSSIRRIVVSILGAFLFSTMLHAQPTWKDYKTIPDLTFYGTVYNGTRIIKANKTTPEYKAIFDGVNDYFMENPGVMADVLKKTFKIALNGVDITFAKASNAKITDLDLFSYKDHQSEGNYSQLQSKLEGLRIPTGDGYGLVLFSYRIDYKDREFKYDIVFFNRQTMKIVAFGNSESDDLNKGIQKEFVDSILEALKNYRFQN